MNGGQKVKKIIRQEILNLRKVLTAEEVASKSENIFNRLASSAMFVKSKNVMVYMDFKNEVSTNLIINYLLKSDKGVIIPITISGTRNMILSQLLDPNKELERNSYGILEPKPQYIRKANPELLDLVIVPGVAFDISGYRIGYGGGYYDTFFNKLAKPIISIALAFDLQIVESVPVEDHDRPVNYIFTESRIIDCKKLRI